MNVTDMQHTRGVTLVELMVVVLVLAILGSIAVPSYRNYMLRAQRTDATAQLLRVRTAQEKFFLQNNTYTADFGPAGLNMTPAAGANMPSEHGHYTITIAINVAGRPVPNFNVTAAPIAGQTADTPCANFSMNELGQRGSGPGPITTCWK